MKRGVKYPSIGKLPAPLKPFASVIVEKDNTDNELQFIATYSCLEKNEKYTI